MNTLGIKSMTNAISSVKNQYSGTTRRTRLTMKRPGVSPGFAIQTMMKPEMTKKTSTPNPPSWGRRGR